MPRKKDVDNRLLLKALGEGIPQAEIMAKFEFKTVAQLKAAIADAAMEAGSVPKLVGGRSKALSASTVRVGKRGSIIIPKDIVESFDFVLGDEFTVRQTKYGLQLRRAGAPDGGDGEE